MDRKVFVIAAVAAVWAASAQAGTAALKCESGKNLLIGKYAACRAKAEGKLAVKNDVAAFDAAVQKCADQLGSKWPILEQAASDAGDACPSTMDQASILDFTDACAGAVATALGGGGNVRTAANLLEGNVRAGLTILGVTGTLTVPSTGQTTASGAGSDGDVRAGSALSYTDNGDGTITDNVTGLMWEKKDDSPGPHNRNQAFQWTGPSYGSTYVMDGGIATNFLATINAGSGFAGHTDWRIPNAKELQSIVNYETSLTGPAVDPAFHQEATCTGCSNTTLASCTCTRAACYWSSTTSRSDHALALAVSFQDGSVAATNKSVGCSARAVRGGA